MATIDFSKGQQSLDMTDPNLVSFGTLKTATVDTWRWATTGNSELTLTGAGLNFDGTGRAVAGRVTRIGIDASSNNAANPDILITGINEPATPFDDGVENFWNFLSGDDVFTGPTLAQVDGNSRFNVFGDGLNARFGASTGGSDVFNFANTQMIAYGDVFTVGSGVPGSLAVTFTGGVDYIKGAATTLQQIFVGDVASVFASGRLNGGNDEITLNSTAVSSSAIGDASVVSGGINDRAEVYGGNDRIDAGAGSQAKLVGDVGLATVYSFVRGGADTIVGGSGGEIIIGDVDVSTGEVVGGNDRILAGDGRDVIVGDVYNANGAKLVGGDDIMNGDGGDDVMYGDYASGTPATVTGGHDRLYGDAGDDTLYGQGGDDLLEGGTGVDRMIGGTGNDTYFMDTYQDVIVEFAGEGVDTIVTTLNDVGLAGTNIENLTYSGNGFFRGGGNALSNTLVGGTGSDTFLADGSGIDFFNGTSGFDFMDFSRVGAVTLNFVNNVHGGSAAGDIFYFIESFLGSEQGDVMRGGETTISFSGRGGNDTLIGGSAADTLYGGTGNDRIDGGAGNDGFLSGDEGNDTITGGAGNDTLSGGDDDDYLDGGDGVDMLDGGAGNDTYVLGSGTDSVVDSGGIDRIFSTVSRSLAQHATIENLALQGAADINGFGNALANLITGNAGNNVLSGAGGIDTLVGGLGNDTYVLAADADIVIDSGGYDTIISTVGRSLAGFAGIERLILDGNGSINGIGNTLNNAIIGNGAKNNIYGGAGNDTLTGGLGRDVLFGEAGNDVFDFNAVTETGNDANTRDVIRDFTRGQDRIDLSTIDANGAAAGDAFSFRGTAAFTGAAGQLRYLQIDAAGTAQDITVVSGDVNGDGLADFQIGLTGLINLVAGDFFL